MLDPKIVIPAIGAAAAKLDPADDQEPVMSWSRSWHAHHRDLPARLVTGGHSASPSRSSWLCFTAVANFREAVAEGRGKAQASRCQDPHR